MWQHVVKRRVCSVAVLTIYKILFIYIYICYAVVGMDNKLKDVIQCCYTALSYVEADY